MAIDLEKPDDGFGSNANNSGPNTSSGKDYNNPNSHPDVRQVYIYAYECKSKNMPDYQIEQSLMNRGLDPAEVAMVMRNVNRAYLERQQAGSQSGGSGGGGLGKAGGTLIIIGLIVLFDILSLAFGWGWVIY